MTKHQDLLDQGYAFPEEKQAAGMLLTLSLIMPITEMQKGGDTGDISLLFV